MKNFKTVILELILLTVHIVKSDEEFQRTRYLGDMQFQGHQYETVSGFVCEAFGYIPRTGECIKVVLEREDEDDNNESSADQQDQKQKNQTFKLEVINLLPSKIVTC